jgi:UDP-glucose 4-epimerase
VLRPLAELLGRRELAQRLFGSLQVDVDATRTLLGWSPPVSVDEGLQRTAARFQADLRSAAA